MQIVYTARGLTSNDLSIMVTYLPNQLNVKYFGYILEVEFERWLLRVQTFRIVTQFLYNNIGYQ